jgi:hypothetical protein
MQRRSMVSIVVLGLLMSGCAGQYQFASNMPVPSSPNLTYSEPEEEAPPPVRAKPRQTSTKPRLTNVSPASSAGSAEPLSPLLTQRPAASSDITTGSSVATEQSSTPASAIDKGRAKQLQAERESDEQFQRQIEHDRRVTSGLCRC